MPESEPVAPLATIADLEQRDGPVAAGDIDRVTALLQDASSAVRAYTGQFISQTTTTVRSRIRNGEIRLSQRPVITVDSVADLDGDDLEGWTFDGIDRLFPPLSADAVVDVTYTHGFAVIPQDIIGVACAIAARSLGSDADPGVTSETIAGYSYSRGTVAAAGPWGMFDQERRVLARYRRSGGSARLSIGYQ
jgi:hypothetical protein